MLVCTRLLGRAQFKPWVPKRTLSHIWLILYLPMFWFNVGLFTLMKIDSLIVLRKSKAPKSNLTKEERIGLAQLKKDKDRVILTVDKEVAMVVMDREEYVSKAQELLAQPAYRSISSDPTNKIKTQLITKLRRIKRDNNLMDGWKDRQIDLQTDRQTRK